MKQLTALLLALTLVLSVGATAFAATPLEDAKAALANIPDASKYPTVDTEGFDEALEQATQIVEALSKIPEKEMLALDGYEEACLAYIQLQTTALMAEIPAVDEITATNVMECITYMNSLNQASWVNYTLLACSLYTELADGEDGAVGMTKGDLVMDEYHVALMSFIDLYDAYIMELSDEEFKAFMIEMFQTNFVQMPETFTMDNIWEYGSQFMDLQSILEIWDSNARPMVSLTDLPADMAADYTVLNAQFQSFMDTNKDALFADIDATILETCDVNRVKDYSYLRCEMEEEVKDDAIYNMIFLVNTYFYEEDAYDLLSHVDIWHDYQELIYRTPAYMGDVNYDFAVDAADALEVLKGAVGKTELTEDQYWRADVNGDEINDAADALEILQYAVGKRESFTIEIPLPDDEIPEYGEDWE